MNRTFLGRFEDYMGYKLTFGEFITLYLFYF
nr:MAG TPA: hypothetical protein [Caudoviricetes sp.]